MVIGKFSSCLLPNLEAFLKGSLSSVIAFTRGVGVAAVVTQVELSAVSRKRRGQILILCKFYLFGDIV